MSPVKSSNTVKEIVPSSNKAQRGVFEGSLFRNDFFGGGLFQGGYLEMRAYSKFYDIWNLSVGMPAHERNRLPDSSL